VLTWSVWACWFHFRQLTFHSTSNTEVIMEMNLIATLLCWLMNLLWNFRTVDVINKTTVLVDSYVLVTGYSSCNKPHRYGNSCHMGSLSVDCHVAEVTFLPLPQPIKTGT